MNAAALAAGPAAGAGARPGGGGLAGHRGADLVRRAPRARRTARRPSGAGRGVAGGAAGRARSKTTTTRVDAPTLHRYAPKVAFQVFHEGRLALRSANAPAAPMVDAGERFTDRLRDGAASTARRGACSPPTAPSATCRSTSASRCDSRGVDPVGGAARHAVADAGGAAAAGAGGLVGGAPRRGAAAQLGRTLAAARAAGAAAGRRRRRAVGDGADAGCAERPVRAHRRADGVGAPLHRRRRARTAHAHRRASAPRPRWRWREADDALRRHALQATLQGCDRATRLVEQLLTLSRLEAGAAPRAAPRRPGALVRQVVAELAPQALEKQQAIEVDARRAVPGAGRRHAAGGAGAQPGRQRDPLQPAGRAS